MGQEISVQDDNPEEKVSLFHYSKQNTWQESQVQILYTYND